MLTKHWKYKVAILTTLSVLGSATLPMLTNIKVLAQNPSVQSVSSQCTDVEIQKYTQQLNKAEQSDFDTLVACQSKAVPALMKALENKDENTRIMIIAALGEIGSQASPAVPLLNELLVRDRSSDVQSITVHALRKINRDRVPVLITNLKSKDWRVRYQAAHTLGQIGVAAKDAVPALTAALEDEIQPVRSSAANALQKLTQFWHANSDTELTQFWHANSDTVMYNTANHVKNNPPVMCRISVIRAVLRWKCP